MGEDERARIEWLTHAQVARSADVDESFLDELVRLGIVEADDRGYRPTDVYRVRFAVLLVASGIRLRDAAEAIDAGVVSFGDLETMFPHPAQATARTHRDLALELGLDTDALLDLRLATGLATRQADDPVRSDDETILEHVVALAKALGGIEHAPAVGRMYGDRAERIASAALGLYRELIDRPWLETGVPLDPDTSRHGSQAGRRLLDRTEGLLLALYRRAIDDELLAGWLETTETLVTRHGYLPHRARPAPGIAFVDLSGYTGLTAEHGDAFGTAMAAGLMAESQRVAAASGIRIVKLLGDGVMLQAEVPGRLVAATMDLVDALAASDMPPAHAGVHAGPLIERDGDYFGHTVNVASRVAGSASAREVLVTAAAAAHLPEALRATELPPRGLRGVPEPIRVFRVERLASGPPG